MRRRGRFCLVLAQAAQHVVGAVEQDTEVARQYRSIHKQTPVYNEDVTDRRMCSVLRASRKWCGGPPCQPFTRRGSGAGWTDVRAQVLVSILLYMYVMKPDVVLLENVPELHHNM